MPRNVNYRTNIRILLQIYTYIYIINSITSARRDDPNSCEPGLNPANTIFSHFKMYKLMKTNLIPKNVVHLLWEKFAMKVIQYVVRTRVIELSIYSLLRFLLKDPQATQEQSKSALKLLGMLAR